MEAAATSAFRVKRTYSALRFLSEKSVVAARYVGARARVP